MSSGTTLTLYGVEGSSESDVFAFGSSGLILHYNGTAWSPMTSGTTAALSRPWVSSPTSVYVPGHSGTILHYNGTTWAPMASGVGYLLSSIWGNSDTDVFAVGFYGPILHYNGVSWSSMTSGVWGELGKVWGTSGTDVFAVGQGGQIWHYNGTAWTQMVSGVTGTLSGIWGNSSTNVFAAGQWGTIVHYDGNSWTQMTSGVTLNFSSIWGSSGANVFAVGDSGVIVHYDGNSWTSMSSGVSGTIWGVWGSSESDVFAVGNAGKILHYEAAAEPTPTPTLASIPTDTPVPPPTPTSTPTVTPTPTTIGGWTAMTSGTTQTLYGIWGSSYADVFAVGRSGVITHYDGTTWTPMSSGTTEWLSSPWLNSPTSAYVAGHSGTILRYNGTAWTPMASGSTQLLTSIWGNSDTDVFAVGYSGAILHYNGISWSPMTSGAWGELSTVWGSSGTDVFTDGAGGQILHYNGTSWSSMASGTTQTFSGLWGSSSADVFAAGFGGTIVHYDGNSWTQMTTGTTVNLSSIWGSSGTDVYAVGDSGLIIHYDGNAWTPMISGVSGTIWCVWGSSASDVFVTCDSGLILHYGILVAPTPTFTPTETYTPTDTPTFTPTETYTPAFTPTPIPTVRTIQFNLWDSHGAGLEGGSVQYYKGGWNAVPGTTDSNGILLFTPPDNLTGSVAFRMSYAYASVQKTQNIDADPLVIFQTAQVAVQLQNSDGEPLDTGVVQYYSGGWRSFGETSGGVVGKELLPLNYSFMMTYGYASNQITQNVDVQPTVVFQTKPVKVQLKNSIGALIADTTAEVKYYSGGWRDFGVTLTGEVAKELLPNSYPFRMNYAFASADKTQNVGDDPTVVFQTTNTVVQLEDSQGNPLDTGTVKYYSGGWRDFGSTTGGQVAKELLPLSYQFSMTYAFASITKTQNITSDPAVIFQTVNAVVQLKDSQGNPLDTGTVKYYSGGWRDFGSTTGGQVAKELLPLSYQFSMTYAFASITKTQNISIDPAVIFQTVNAAVQLKDSQGNPLDTGTVKYYSGGWRDFGSTSDGVASKELLSLPYQFSLTYAYVSNQIAQDINVNPVVLFQTGQAHSESGSAVKYYSGGWRDFYQNMQLLPGSLIFRFNDGAPDSIAAITAGVVNLIH